MRRKIVRQLVELASATPGHPGPFQGPTTTGDDSAAPRYKWRPHVTAYYCATQSEHKPMRRYAAAVESVCTLRSAELVLEITT